MNLVRDRVGAITICDKVSLRGPYKMEGSCEEACGGKEVGSYFSRVLDKGKASC
jgi:hypothetical protein